ncbi:MAG TPA: DNA repair protein RecO [Clostridia bacterium]|nr:DNA repair protein RecO [Clostridia bacterium]
MPLGRCEAVIIRVRDYGDADRFVTLYSRERGKVHAVARGARRSKSRFVGVQPFVHGVFSLFSTGGGGGGGASSLSQFQILSSFRVLREDLDLMAGASYVAQVIDEITAAQDPNEEVFRLLLWSLGALEKSKGAVFDVRGVRDGIKADMGTLGAVLRVFEIKLLQYLGYQPHLDSCVKCGSIPATFFHPASGGVLCERCGGLLGDAAPLSPGSVSIMKAVLNADLAKLGVLKMTSFQSSELRRPLEEYVSMVAGRPIRALEFLKILEGKEGLA